MSDLGPDLRAILSEGLAGDGPSPERRTRVKARLFAAVTSGALALGGAASGAAAPAAAGSLGLVKGLGVATLLAWFGTGAALGVGASGLVALASERSPDTQPAAAVREPAPEARRLALSARAAAPAPVVSHLDDAPVRAATSREPSQPAPGVPRDMPSLATSAPALPPSSAASLASSLSEESRLLQRAERALAAENPEIALASVGEHAAHFPAGTLREERLAVEVLALCELGRVEEARSRARAFVRAAPRSVLVPRLERSCAAPF